MSQSSRYRSRREHFSWLKPQEVRWGDMDALGHVNNAVYLSYSETARIAFFDELFADTPSFMNGEGPILASLRCDYHQQLHYPAQIEVGVGIRQVGRSSLELISPVFRVDEDLAVADMFVTLVWFDYAKQRSMPVPERLRAWPRLPDLSA